MARPSLLLVSVMMAGLLGSSTIGHAASTPTDTVKETIATVMNIMNDPVFQEAGMSDARRAAIESLLRKSVTYETMARKSLGIAWNILGDAEREHFGDLFVKVLRDAIASRMSGYASTQVLFISEKREGDFAEVRTLFRRDKDETTVDVRLVNQSGQWRMYDAVIDGVRLVENYHAQFVHVMQQVAYAGLIGRLEAMTILPKTFERAE